MKQMTLMQHFSELRRRVLWVALIFALCFVFGWWVAPFLQQFLTQPLMAVWPDGELLYTGLSDGLMIHFSLATLFSLIVILPVALWHVWAFVKPGLKQSEQNFIWPMLILSPILFVCGAAFVFYFLLPIVFNFFVGLNTAGNVPNVFLPDAREYLQFVIKMLRVFGLAFQLPLIMVLLNKIGIIDRLNVIKMRRYVIVLIVVLIVVVCHINHFLSKQLYLATNQHLLYIIFKLYWRKKCTK